MRYKYALRILDEDAKENLKNFFVSLEKEIQKEGLGDIIFQIVYELINNAVKANLKRSFFIKNNYSFDDLKEYEKGLADFKKQFRILFSQNKAIIRNIIEQENIQKEWLSSLQELNLTTHLFIDANQKRILIYVSNNTTILPQEEKRLREILSKAMNSKNLIEFMIHYGPISEEGEGLGLALVVLLIKEAGFKPEYFRVFKKGTRTIARVEFPLSKDYIPIREKLNQRNNII